MNIETSASVYSVLTASAEPDERNRVAAYLYDHSTVVEEYPGDRFTFFILKTTANDVIDSETRTSFGSSNRDLVAEAFYLANYQLDRFASGSIGGILAGDLHEAKQLVAETVNA